MTTEVRSLAELETMSAEAFTLDHPLADKLITMLKSARGYRRGLERIEHLRDIRGERWTVSMLRYYTNMLKDIEGKIDAVLAEINPNG